MTSLTVDRGSTCVRCGTPFVAPKRNKQKQTCSQRCASSLSKIPSGWTKERDLLIKTLWADGLFASQIAGELSVTRNAVIGRLHRLGVAGERPKQNRASSNGSGLAFTVSVPSFWTDDREDRLRELCIQGLSAPAIACELGTSRSAVTSKAIRLGLVLADTRRNTQQKAIIKIEEPTFTSDQDIPLAQRCQLLDLTDEKCRYPIGEPGINLFFCGGAALPFKPYCNHHFSICCPGAR